MGVDARSLWQGLELDWEIAAALVHDALEEVLGPRILRVEGGLVGAVELGDVLDVLVGPLAVKEGLDDVTNPVEHRAGVLLVLVVTQPELPVSARCGCLRILGEVPSLVRVRQNAYGKAAEQDRRSHDFRTIASCGRVTSTGTENRSPDFEIGGFGFL